MPHEDKGVVGLFADPASAAGAIRELVGRGVKGLSAQSPAPYHELEAALGKPRSRLGWVTLVGGLTGLAAAIAFTTWTSLEMPMLVSGKPIVSTTAYVVIYFELMVLFAGITNFIAVMIGSAMARKGGRFHERATVDRVAVFVPAGSPGEVDAILRRHGAEEVAR
ncbi:MAG: DUF3341 domain-containing protein [Myxococcales bacterium]|nr:DUF3341 domain-containing protein [Myxococcales bacterium]